jgi:serine protease AprX
MVETQPEIHPLLDTSTKSVRARGSSLYSPNTAWEVGYTGKDIVVAVLDTGVDDEHEFLKGKFIAGFDCSGPAPGSDREINPDDLDGHGTHVTSIIMSTGGLDETYKGVAPDAKLVDVKVLGDVGKSFSGQLIRGIEWVIENKDKYNITIINLSVGLDIEDPDGTSAPSQAANMAVENGLIVIAAAGNKGPDTQTLTAPSVAEKAICVTALDDMNTINRVDDIITSYSSRGPGGNGAKKPDITAPGNNIIGARAVIAGNASNEIIMMSGTSMAAPHVTGVVALILQANPNLSPSEVKQNLLNTAEDKGETGWDVDYGWGEVEAYKAVASALNVDFRDFDEPSSTQSLLSLEKIVNGLISQLLITGYEILMPGGIITIIAVTTVVVIDTLVYRKKDEFTIP